MSVRGWINLTHLFWMDCNWFSLFFELIPHTSIPYVKCGSAREEYIVFITVCGTSGEILCIIPATRDILDFICWMCSEKVNFSSISIPRNFVLVTLWMGSPSIMILIWGMDFLLEDKT